MHGDVFTYRTLSSEHTRFVAQKINDSCFDALSRQNLEIEGYCDVLHDC